MDNEVPNRLSEAIKRDKLIIFAGAGLSRDNGLPTWNKIIEDFLNNDDNDIKNADILVQNLKTELMDPLEVLEKIKDEKALILEHFENNLIIDDLVSETHKILASITKKFITTNFDKLIESNTQTKNIITFDSKYNLQKIGKKKDFVIKLHGDISKPDSCIIFKEQYDELYKNDDQLATFKLKSLLSDYTFLFIGFSFTDAYVNDLFNYMSELLDGLGPKHYMLSASDKKINNIENINIQDYNNMNIFLKKLANIRANRKKDKDEDKDEDSKPKYETTIEITDEDFIFDDDGSDIAPNVTNWVGRKKELDLLKQDFFKVIFITGIGGEGKSALASHYLNEANNFEILDWRDFKEEDHKFQMKIISMILTISSDTKVQKLVGLTNDKLINLFFNKLKKRKALFVLDNVDSYIDYEKCEPIGNIGALFKAALKHEHNSKFIFTCRPFIMHSGVDFYHLKLTGLTKEATLEYFNKGNTNIKRERLPALAEKAYTLTNGHALWLSLILAQSNKGEEALKAFLNSIELGEKNIDINQSAYLSKKMLGSIWEMLETNEKTILRVLAEAVYSESIDNYSNVVKKEMNYQKFEKALKTLNSLNLIIHKRNTDYIELHPLVKEFIKSNYLLADRRKYISMIIQYYDGFAVLLKNKLSYKSKYEDFTHFTKKAELYVNAGDSQRVIDTILSINDSMVSAGYTEELLRVTKLFYNLIKWEINKIEQYHNFNDLFRSSVKNFAEFGDKDYALELISKYEKIIESKSDNYLLICEIKSYIFWLNQEFNKSIDICEEALYLIKRAEQEDKYDIRYNYNLILRDTRVTENIDKALEFFLSTYTLNDLISNDMDLNNINGVTYGNVGKCLLLKEDYQNSLICNFKSFYSLYCFTKYQRKINLGYAALWISEVLIKQEEYEKAYYFLAFAKDCWYENAPALYNQNLEAFDIIESDDVKVCIPKEFWKIDKYCTELIEESLNIKFKQ